MNNDIDTDVQGLGPDALATLADEGIAVADWIAYGGWMTEVTDPTTGQARWVPDTEWRGDSCGCTDDRCIGYHHDEHDECGCLPVLIEERATALEAYEIWQDYREAVEANDGRGDEAAYEAAWARAERWVRQRDPRAVTFSLDAIVKGQRGISATVAGEDPGYVTTTPEDGAHYRQMLWTVPTREQLSAYYGVEPLRVRLPVAGILHELMDTEALYDQSQHVLNEEYDAAIEQLPAEPDGLAWHYGVEEHRTDEGVEVQLVALEEGAPPFDEARWRDDLAAFGFTPRGVESMVSTLYDRIMGVTATAVSRDDAGRAALVDIDTRTAALLAPYQQRLRDLEDLQTRERTEYAHRLRDAVVQYAGRRYPHLEAVVDVDLDPNAYDEPTELDHLDDLLGRVRPEKVVLQHAIDHTPLPGSGLAPRDYPPGPIGDHERAAGRLPHTRLVQPSGAEPA